MISTPESPSRGSAVEPAQIDKALKQLWAANDGVSTRASLMNLAVYTEAADGLDSGSALISELTRTHACRALLINARPESARNTVQSWINVHCHVPRAGSKQVCCEQLSFLLEGTSTNKIPSIVFSHLDSDLPLIFCWLGNLHSFTDPRFWTWVDKLIYDSLEWDDPKRAYAVLREIQQRVPRLCLRDLNWMRSVYLRGALVRAFDHPEAWPLLDNLAEIEIHHTPERRLTALLVVGWLFARLNWKSVVAEGSDYVATTNAGREIKISLRDAAGEGFSKFLMTAHGNSGRVAITREPGGRHYITRTEFPGEGVTERLMPAGTRGVSAILNEELARGSRSHNCEIALERVLELL